SRVRAVRVTAVAGCRGRRVVGWCRSRRRQRDWARTRGRFHFGRHACAVGGSLTLGQASENLLAQIGRGLSTQQFLQQGIERIVAAVVVMIVVVMIVVVAVGIAGGHGNLRWMQARNCCLARCSRFLAPCSLSSRAWAISALDSRSR